MQAFYISKRSGGLALAYVLALLLLLAGARIFLPPAETASAAYRSGSGSQQVASLSVNVDWGNEYIPAILEALAQAEVKATFFLSGRWADEYPELARSIADAGHEIGNHGYSHTSPNASSVEQIIDEIERTEQAIEKAAGVRTRLYAPPSGEEQPHVLEAATEAGYQMILWSVDTIDWQQPPAQTIIERVLGKLHAGAIILAHPTAGTAEALPQLLEQMKAEGYSLVTVSENLGL
ncbi:MAG: polysaccharide deacetylase family protein [Bacillota bacterium]|nr:polysaccharide deacetylase family protein [Bacillota bacterium]